MTADANTIARVSAPVLEEVLGRRFRVLDDGFVRVIDYMGDDTAVVQAARVSYGQGTKQVHEDRGLIRYLMRHQHSTPLEMCELKLHVRVPMDCWRQWIRHRTASVNEYSTRYSVAIDAAQHTLADQWRAQSANNRQGSAAVLSTIDGAALSAQEADLLRASREIYTERLSKGVAREQARKDLPLSTYTEAYWKINLHNLLHFLKLRMEEHAQTEIRAYATIVGEEIVRRWCPMVWEAFNDYHRAALTLSRAETIVLRALRESPQRGHAAAIAEGFLPADGRKPKRHRELEELEAKLTSLGFAVPWSGQ